MIKVFELFMEVPNDDADVVLVDDDDGGNDEDVLKVFPLIKGELNKSANVLLFIFSPYIMI